METRSGRAAICPPMRCTTIHDTSKKSSAFSLERVGVDGASAQRALALPGTNNMQNEGLSLGAASQGAPVSRRGPLQRASGARLGPRGSTRRGCWHDGAAWPACSEVNVRACPMRATTHARGGSTSTTEAASKPYTIAGAFASSHASVSRRMASSSLVTTKPTSSSATYGARRVWHRLGKALGPSRVRGQCAVWARGSGSGDGLGCGVEHRAICLLAQLDQQWDHSVRDHVPADVHCERMEGSFPRRVWRTGKGGRG